MMIIIDYLYLTNYDIAYHFYSPLLIQGNIQLLLLKFDRAVNYVANNLQNSHVKLRLCALSDTPADVLTVPFKIDTCIQHQLYT